ncbi:MAG: asparagine synthase (glutamine-hydrolyzing) [Candidatus Acidiferrales bacterium]
MCGISGIATRRLERADLERSINRMARSIRHRGPDGLDSRCFVPPAISQSVALAHNRLAIIDISPAGCEPMANEDGTVWLVFNGEIYNFIELRSRLESRGHRFHSHTDAEVIIHLYEEAGPACVKQLDGIFAFAILDLSRDLLLLARDPLGVKPLFYAVIPHHFLFGSEIKALLASSLLTAAPDWQAISDFFTYLYVPGPETAFTGVQQLLPAHTLTLHLQDNSIALDQYWDVSRREDLQSMSYEELKSQIQETLAAAVKRQLVSDVPLGVFLSGGIDSTIVAGLAKREKKDTQTYTLGLPGHEYRFFDETETAHAVSRHLRTAHRELSLEFPDLLEMLDLIEFFDQPFANPTSYLMHQLSQKAREHITVALCGAGGDELFAGYPRASGVRLARRLAWMPRPLLRLGANALSLMRDSHQTPYLRRARKFLGGLDRDFFVQYTNWTYFMNEDQKRSLLLGHSHCGNSHSSVNVLRSAYAQSQLRDEDNRILQMDLKTFLVDNILDYTDRMSMAKALEVRVPLLDAAFVELSLNTPFAYKIRNGASKAILVDAFEEFFPPEACNAPKRGFNAPLALWAGSLFDPYFEASLNNSHPLRARLGKDIGAAWNDGILDLNFLQQLRLQHRQGKRDNAHELFACILFDVWWRKYIKRSQPMVHWQPGPC